MTTETFTGVLNRLCLELGLCLSPMAAAELESCPPVDALRATAAILRADHLDPDQCDSGLRRRVHEIVSEAYYGEPRSPEADVLAPHVVTIVLDGQYADRLETLDRGAIWIIDTPKNRRVAHELWQGTQTRNITTFRSSPNVAVHDTLAGVVPDVDLHHGVLSQHPPYSAIEVIGCRATVVVQRILENLGFELERPTTDGFIARRIEVKD